MKVLVVGAAGKTGRAVVEQAVKAGHEVTALVHSATTMGAPGVDVRVGDASDASTADAAVAGQDAVIDTVGGRTPYRRTTLETQVATSIITAMQHSGVRRLIVTSAIGVGDSLGHASLLTKVIVATFLRGSTRDKAAMEAAVRRSELAWVIIRPAVLNDKPATGDVRAFHAGTGEIAKTISRADLAAFLVAQLTSDDHLLEAVTVANG